MAFDPQLIIEWISNKTSEASAYGIQKLAEIGINPGPTLSKLVAIFLGALLIFIGTKVGQKVAKFVMIIVGLLIVASIVYSFF